MPFVGLPVPFIYCYEPALFDNALILLAIQKSRLIHIRSRRCNYSEFLSSLTPLTNVPEDVESECAICIDEFTEPCQLSCSHVFCKSCISEWASRRSRNTCPTCRRALFDVSCDTDRAPEGTDRLQVVARAMEHSGLMTDDRFDDYSDENYYSAFAIHQAASQAYQYLTESSHPAVRGPVLVNIRILGPALIAMGNLLRGYAQATGRPYSGFQRRDWKLIVGHLAAHLELANGVVRDSGVGMNRELGARIRQSLRQDLIDLNSGRFFESGARVQSPSGDLDILLNYVVFVCAKAYQDREARVQALRQAQRAALDREPNTFRWMLRKAGQVILGRV